MMKIDLRLALKSFSDQELIEILEQLKVLQGQSTDQKYFKIGNISNAYV